VLKTTQLSAHAQNHASPERCRKSFTIIFLGDHDIPLTGSNFGNLTAFRAFFSHIFALDKLNVLCPANLLMSMLVKESFKDQSAFCKVTGKSKLQWHILDSPCTFSHFIQVECTQCLKKFPP